MRFAETLRVTLTSLRQFDNLLGDRVTGRINGSIGTLERYKSHFKGDAHETRRLRIEFVALQVGSDRHRVNCIATLRPVKGD